MIPREDARPKPEAKTRRSAASKAAAPAADAPERNSGSGQPRPYEKAVGTPLYMSPEHISGRPFDTHADDWAFGCTIFETMGLVRVLHQSPP